jgi:tripartite-type tricarboxylate transporter receptor subunit TctC
MEVAMGFADVVKRTITLIFAVVATSQIAFAQSDFYAGRQITLIIPAGAGGGYALYSQILAGHLGKHIPGNPTVVTQHMPGAGGNVAANYLYNAAPKDGSVIGALFSTLTITQALEPSGVRFDANKFSWIGSIAPMVNTLGIWFRSPADSFDKAKSTEVIMGATGKSSELYIYPKIMNELLGTKFKIVLGYDGSGAILLAMERGEVNGMAMALEAWTATRPEWVQGKKIIHLAQTGPKRDPQMPDVPTLVELAKSPEDKAVMSFLAAPAALGRIVAAPPGIPADRLAILRKAFDDTMQSEDFKKDLTTRGLSVEPMPGKQLEEYVRQISSTPPEQVQRAKRLLGF